MQLYILPHPLNRISPSFWEVDWEEIIWLYWRWIFLNSWLINELISYIWISICFWKDYWVMILSSPSYLPLFFSYSYSSITLLPQTSSEMEVLTLFRSASNVSARKFYLPHGWIFNLRFVAAFCCQEGCETACHCERGWLFTYLIVCVENFAVMVGCLVILFMIQVKPYNMISFFFFFKSKNWFLTFNFILLSKYIWKC